MKNIYLTYLKWQHERRLLRYYFLIRKFRMQEAKEAWKKVTAALDKVRAKDPSYLSGISWVNGFDEK